MCKEPECSNKPTRWSRTGFCRDHKHSARAFCAARRHRIPLVPSEQNGPIVAMTERQRVFEMLVNAIRQRFPRAGLPYAVNPSGYEVLVLAPGGLRA